MSPEGIQHRSSLKIQDIEILRGVAVISVVIQHLHGVLITQHYALFDFFFRYFGLGVGVDIFFAVSGFVIARQLVLDLLGCRSSGQRARVVASFWIRRFWRLLPSAWLWLALILLAVFFFNRSGAFGSVQANYEATIAGVFQFANVRFADLFLRAEYGASFVYWSLSTEEQFYLLFPFVVLLAGKKIPWVLALAAFIQLAAPRNLLWFLLRTEALALGALIAWWQSYSSYRTCEPKFMGRRWLRGPVLLALLSLMAWASAAGIRFYPYNTGLVSLFGVLLVFFASYDRGYVDVPAPLRPLLLWLGSRSYTLYLVHVPAFFLTREIFYRLAQAAVVDGAEHWLRMLIVSIIIAIFLVEINYRYIEVPCRLYGANLAKKIARKI